ncbi:TetR/AcrR family transcriptional regulator [Corticicoccus populi]|uniref:TetR/AcrR family transcriptional regulator n=1 Tax=Corticicoccus populi TaxID=1812821 RepID=A0ABW5X259_9STAP
MENRKDDLRKIKTRMALDGAFTSLIKEKSFDDISVKDITERAMINRGTFYMHFQDKYELLNAYETELLSGLSKNLMENIDEHQKLTRKMAKDIAIKTFEYVDVNSERIIALFNNPGVKGFEQKIQEYMSAYYRDKVSQILNPEKVKVDIDYLIAYITGAHISLMKRWLENQRRESWEELAQILEIISVKGPFYAAGISEE